MNFVLWVCRAMHLFGVVVWLGGLMFQNAVARPVVQFEPETARIVSRKIDRRFVAFIWMCVWTVLVTGVLLMLLSPKFFWFNYSDRWSILLGAKQAAFVLMTVYGFGYARMAATLEKLSGAPGDHETVRIAEGRLQQFRTISIFIGIIALLLATAMY